MTERALIRQPHPSALLGVLWLLLPLAMFLVGISVSVSIRTTHHPAADAGADSGGAD